MKSNTTTSVSSITLLMLAALSAVSLLALPVLAVPPAPVLLDPKTIPKFVNQLVVPPVYAPTVATDPATGKTTHYYTVDVTQFTEQILPTTDAAGLPTGFGPTTVWGYGGLITGGVYFRNSPGATFEATRGIPIVVEWQNKLTGPHLFAVDPTLHWANPNNFPMPMPPVTAPAFPPGYPEAQSPVPIVTHLHGGEVQSYYDGGPDEWFTSGTTPIQGPGYSTYTTPSIPNAAVYYYPNTQLPTTLWYHDHALGITRINVMSGLAGFYLLRDPADTIASLLPSGPYEIPLAIQDRTFMMKDPTTGNNELWFPNVGINPTIHPYWMPEFFGNTIMVNGKVWPNLNVEPRQYRFRLLDGSNARFYTLSFSNKMQFIQIGSDGGYLPAPVTLTELTIAPGERADVLVDFSALAPGTKVILTNTAKTPFPKGAPADPQTVGQIMQFTVLPGTPIPPNPLLPPLNTIPILTPDQPARTLVLWEVMGVAGPLEILLNGQKWAADISELPKVGTTEDWIIVNPTADTHPIHLHLVQFQLVSRQALQTKKYTMDWLAIQTDPGLNNDKMPPWTLDYKPTELPVALYVQGKPVGPAPNEMGWKDTIQAPTGMVTIIRVRYAPQDATGSAPGINKYPFDPTLGPGYVWHCHIIDHEDNEMMRPYKVT